MKNVLGVLLILTLETVPARAVLGQCESSVSLDQQGSCADRRGDRGVRVLRVLALA